MSKLHLFTTSSPFTRRAKFLSIEVDCGHPVVNPTITPIWDVQGMNQRMDLAGTRGLCKSCLEAKPKDVQPSDRQWIYAVNEGQIVEVAND